MLFEHQATLSFTEVHPPTVSSRCSSSSRVGTFHFPCYSPFSPSWLSDQCFRNPDGTFFFFKEITPFNSVSEDLPVLFCYKSTSVLNRGTEPGEQTVRTQMSMHKPSQNYCMILTLLSEEKAGVWLEMNSTSHHLSSCSLLSGLLVRVARNLNAGDPIINYLNEQRRTSTHCSLVKTIEKHNPIWISSKPISDAEPKHGG